MHIGILGTGIVGQVLGARFADLGHEVRMGSRTSSNPAAAEWAAKTGPRGSHGTFADAAEFGDIVLNCTGGGVSVAAAEAAGADALAGKVLIDVSNPLEFQPGQPVTLSVCNTDSVGEQLQRALPRTRVVKALSTVNCAVMVAPESVPGSHVLPICGNDIEAKEQVTALLGELGWPRARVIDLGDITGARAMEMYLPMWLRLMGVLGTAAFNIELRR